MVIGLCVCAQRPKLLRICYERFFKITEVFVKIALKKGWYP